MSKVKKEVQTNDSAKEKYQILNWREYNKALVNRGDITIYFNKEVQGIPPAKSTTPPTDVAVIQ